MKKKITFLSFGFMLLFFGSVYSQAVPELIYYKFDTGDTITNYASTPVGINPAVIVGTGHSIGDTGLVGTALVGTGVSSGTNYVNTGWNTNLTGSWTIGFYTKNIQPTTTLWYIFGDNTAGNFRCFTNGAAGASNWRLIATGLPAVQAQGAAVVAPTYTHFVYDQTAGNIKSYVNGVISQTVTVPGTPSFTATAGPFKVGAQSSSSSLNGILDEFRLYNRALSDTEILATYNITLGFQCDSLSAGSPNSNLQSICLGDSVNLDATSVSTGLGVTYQWQESTDSLTFTDVAGATNINTSVAPSDTTFYRLIVNCLSSSDTSAAVKISVSPLPRPTAFIILSMGALPTVTVNATTSMNASQYLWDFGDGTTDTGAIVSHTYTVNNQYNIKLTANNNCGTDSAVVSVNVTNVGVNKLNMLENLKLFPNPSTGLFNIAIEDPSLEHSNLYITDLNGRLVYSENLQPNQETMNYQLDLNHLADGFYNLNLSSKQGVRRAKLIIQR